MNSQKQFWEILNQTRVVRYPKHRLATFGNSEIHYNLVTAVSDVPPRSNLRTGRVAGERPKSLTPEALSRHFEGFGEQSENYERWLKENFQEAFRGLGYSFKNRLDETAPHHTDARDLLRNIQRDLDRRDVPHFALISGPEEGWQFSLMKFILEETSRSFPANVRELDERNLFDPAQAVLNRKKREIESLFHAARRDPSRIRALGEKLKEHGLFNEYQDRFFSLLHGAGDPA